MTTSPRAPKFLAALILVLAALLGTAVLTRDSGLWRHRAVVRRMIARITGQRPRQEHSQPRWRGALAASPDTSPLTLTIATADRHPISRFIYGANFVERGTSPRGAGPWFGATVPPEITLTRFGGNRLSAFNWETGASNVGQDGNGTWSNDRFLVHSGNGAWDYGDGVGDAVMGRVAAARAQGRAILLTIPMLGWVAGDAPSVALDTTSANRPARLARHFVRSVAAKRAPFTRPPSLNDGIVHQDELAHLVDERFPGAVSDSRSPVFFELDNEPDLWPETHAEVVNTRWTYDSFADTSAAYARAIKAAAPGAVVFGPAVATYTGLVAGDRYYHGWINDPQHGRENFLDVYLDRLRTASDAAHQRLLDVMDLHWYPAVGTRAGSVGNDDALQDSAMIDKRLQAPRSLWDSTYTEQSWVAELIGGPIGLIPRLREQVARHFAGTKLAITEYYYGRGGDISGGLAQADVLGVFGREGLFAAALWANGNVNAPPYAGDGKQAYAYIFAAFRLFLNYDGAGARFGDSGVAASASDPARASVYAALDPSGRVTIIAINKGQRAAEPVTIAVAHSNPLLRATVLYRLTGASRQIVRGNAHDVAARGTSAGVSRFSYTMPPLSASVIVLAP